MNTYDDEIRKKDINNREELEPITENYKHDYE